jgi:signal transduction histidine kinase
MKINTMFTSATLKLTGAYLLIIMLLSIIFSFVVYNVSISELEAALTRQSVLFEGIDLESLPTPLNLTSERLEAVLSQLEESNSQIRQDLLLANIVIFFIGGLVGFALARRTLKPIEEAHDQQQRFIADASHELRTPLTSIRAQLEVALRKNLEQAEMKKVVKSSIEEVDRLVDLSDSLLLLAKSEESLDTSTKVSVHELASRAKERVSVLAANKNINITIDENDVQLNCNEYAIVEVLTVLLENGIKYSKPDKDISIAAEAAPTRIIVTDQGIGIPKSSLDHIFDRFYRVDNSRTKQSAEGYGIGLAIAKQIMDRHKGKVKVSSDQDKGSTFTLIFPS